MTSKEIIQEVIKELEWHKKEDTMYEAETNLLLPDMEQVLKDLEILELIKKTGILDLVFSDDPYCNLVITNKDVINVDYDGHAPDIEMTWEEYEKFKEWLDA